jgi:hypothetical protein
MEVDLNGALANVELAANPFIGQAFGHQQGNPAFAGGQHTQYIFRDICHPRVIDPQIVELIGDGR